MVESLTQEKRLGDGMDFLEDPPKDLLCLLCHTLATDPQQTACDCALLYCKACLERLGETSSECPRCKVPLRALPDKLRAQRITALGVKCSAEMSGCGWSGELGQLETHLHTCENSTESTAKKRNSCSTEPYCQDAQGCSGQATAGSRKKHLSSQQMKETETKDDVLMLHLPFLIVCFMIVCITLSSCIMGYI